MLAPGSCYLVCSGRFHLGPFDKLAYFSRGISEQTILVKA